MEKYKNQVKYRQQGGRQQGEYRYQEGYEQQEEYRQQGEYRQQREYRQQGEDRNNREYGNYRGYRNQGNHVSHRKCGFTLTEIIVVLVIMAILLALAIPAARNYIKQAEFRRNESHARTAYLAAESTLTWYRTSGRWEEFRREVIHAGTLNETFEEGDRREGRIYALIFDGSAPGENPAGDLARDLLEGTAFDQQDAEGIIALEIDIETGQVYSAFYGTRCLGLSYEGSEDGKVLNISAAGDNRSYGNRKKYLLGYYSAEDVTNAVDLKPARLKITTINLVNRETLSLNWSSNSRHDNLDVSFHIAFFQKEASGNDLELFSLDVDRYQLRQKYGSDSLLAGLDIKKREADGTQTEAGTWYFPLSYESGRFSLVLDAMMSAELIETLRAGAAAGAPDVGDMSALGGIRAYGTSITRLALGEPGTPAPAPSLAQPQDIYAVISIQPTYENMEGDSREYQSGASVRSNTENTLFGSVTAQAGGEGMQAKISQYRHLSNIRYCQAAEAEFTLASRNMDWMSAGTGLYDLKKDRSGFLILNWRNAGEGNVDFPTIPTLAHGHTLTGGGEGTLLTNLRLGRESLPDDGVIERLYGDHPSEDRYGLYLGLFGQVEGDVRNLTLRNPRLDISGESAGENNGEWEHLRGVGILCGRSQGNLENIAVRSESGKALVRVLLADRPDTDHIECVGVGGLVGVLAETDEDGEPVPLADAAVAIKNLTMEGAVEVRLPSPRLSETAREGAGGESAQGVQTMLEAALSCPMGAGGIFGFGKLDGVKLSGCNNHASVTGNLFAGGIGGNLTGNYGKGASPGQIQGGVSLEKCSNDGLVLCSADHSGERLEGRYFGGILGFGHKVWIESASSASGRAAGYQYTAEDKDKLLGQYVGGIIGYGNSSLLTGCSTQKGGYILGAHYVGGIAGGLSNDIAEVIKGNSGVAVTVNAGYVIGLRYVGGIVGINGAGDEVSVVSECVNNGVAAGYDRYIGGIVGYNGEKGKLFNCASYLSDYDGSVFQMIHEKWQAAGDCAGGLAGYNNGAIEFEEDNVNITVKSVSSVVVGRNFVGGMIGFNDAKGTLKSGYTLIGGQVYGYGDCVGGMIGLNASESIFDQKLTIRPQSVTGIHCVGGCIGANVVELTGDRQALNLRTDNVLGSITGRAFTGGIIGYHRSYTTQQLQKALEQSGAEGADRNQEDKREETPLLQYLMLAGEEGISGYVPLLPCLGQGNLPTQVLVSENGYSLTVGNSVNTRDSLGYANNNIPIRSYIYTGGIVGYCEQGSSLVLQNCKNTGNISRPTAGAEGEEIWAAGVSLKAYLAGVGMLSASSEAPELSIHMSGGIISASLENQIVDHCANTGNMSGFVGLGGIVGFNAGGIFNCELSDNFGSAALDCIGGIAGLNGKADSGRMHYYRDVKDVEWKYASGLIAGCSTHAGRNILGRSYVGGITGFNMAGAQLWDNDSRANISASGDFAGGIAGANGGTVRILEDKSEKERSVSGGQGVGGIVGWNRAGGIITCSPAETQDADKEETEWTAVGDQVTITGRKSVGGIVGIHEGELTLPKDTVYLTCRAKQVRASEGWAGGIAGTAGGGRAGKVVRAVNRSGRVTADRGPAGGITAVNESGMELSDCRNMGSVNSDAGYAGGIVAENFGIITDCLVGEETEAAVTLEISSRGSDAVGAVCAVNHEGAVIRGSVPRGKNSKSGETNILLSGQAGMVGGVAGVNRGNGVISGNQDGDTGLDAGIAMVMPRLSLVSDGLTVGGVCGRNEGTIEEIRVEGAEFIDFAGYRYLGGIAGENQEGAVVSGCVFSQGVMRERSGSSAAGNCYGGIAGENRGTLHSCEVLLLDMQIQGVYTATATSTAAQKEASATHVGGVAGKNEESGLIRDCVIGGGTDGSPSKLQITSGMAGGVAGYNKGRIELSGDPTTEWLMRSEGLTASLEELIARARELKIQADPEYVAWSGNTDLDTFAYNGSGKNLCQDRTLILTMSTNGNLGGITAYNAPGGYVDYCATGNWYLNNKSDAIGVGTGGIIGMNESERNLTFLLNRAFVGRQISTQNTNRFAGGIIGNQNNTTKGGWKIENCVNYGTVYCLRTHYSGGILGQWTGTGGTLEKCRNYGNLQTTYATGWVGASGGMAAQLYHPYEGNEYNIISCGNYGNIYGRLGRDNRNCANDSAGILGNVTTYESAAQGAGTAQDFTIQVLDCVNGSGVEIYSNSMASGIVGFFSCDNPSYERIINATANVKLRIERCRNFAAVLKGSSFVGGIFGERYGGTGSANTVLKDCFSVNREAAYYGKPDYPIVSYQNNSNKGNVSRISAVRNYFLEGQEKDDTYGFKVSETQEQVTVKAPAEGRARASANNIYYLVQNGDQYFVYLTPGQQVSKNDLTVDPDGTVLMNQQEAGRVLFQIGSGDTTSYENMSAVVGQGSRFDDYVRTAWYVQETGRPAGGASQMPKPQSVSLIGEGNQIRIHVEPAENTDPFYYTAVLYLDSEGKREVLRDNIIFYAEDYSIGLSQEDAVKAGVLVMEVRACSMYEEVKPSEPAFSNEADEDMEMLPVPELRIELIASQDGYEYFFSLENQEEFQKYRDFLIQVRFMDGSGKLNLIADADGKVMGVSRKAEADSLQQLLVQAVPADGNNQLRPSSQVSLPVYLPGEKSGYKPSIRLGSLAGSGMAVPEYRVTGNSLSELSVAVTLDASKSGIVTTPPIYRAELIGIWEQGQEQITAVLSAADVLTAANGRSTAVFSNLPEYIAEAQDIRVRVWYAQSGLGPVYTSHSLPDGEGANLQILLGRDESQGAEAEAFLWEYGYSLPLSDAGLADCRWTSDILWKWLPRPRLSGVEGSLTPEFDSQKRLQYVFAWDQEPGDYAAGQEYIVSLTGIRGEDRVTILSGVTVDSNQYIADAEDWSYETVEITVTRKGDAQKGEIGLPSTGVYQVGQRLPRPSQALVSNSDPNRNEFRYTFQWAPIAPEAGCSFYEIWLQPYLDDGVTLDDPRLIGQMPAGSGNLQEDGQYKTVLDLKDYTGKRVVVYLIARADDADLAHVDSVAGVTCEVSVPKQIPAPRVQWRKNWEYDRTKPVTAQVFEYSYSSQTEGLVLEVAPDADSIPPGDSSYLVKAYVFDSQENAEGARTALDGGLPPGTESALPGLVTVYSAWDADGGVTPRVMDADINNLYSHTLQDLSAQYAGKWILFYVRISSGNGMIGSAWTANDTVWRLPYVVLPVPEVTIADQDREVTALVQLNPDLPGTEELWKANRTILTWNSQELADCAYLTLTAKDGTAADYRLVESTQDDAKSVTLYRYQNGTVSSGDAAAGAWVQAGAASWLKGPDGVWVWNGGTKEDGSAMDGGQAVFEMSDYGFTVQGSYTEAGLVTPYTIRAQAVLEVSGDGADGFRYTLVLPDADSVSPKDGILLTDKDLLYTAAVRLKADVTQNAPDGSAYSDAYVESEPYEAVFGAAAQP